MAGKTYEQRYDGDWMTWEKSGHVIACCDCGLVHFVKPRVRKGKVQIQARRLPHYTAARRRGMSKRA